MWPLLLRRLMQASPLFIIMLFHRLPSDNSTKWFLGSTFWSKLINFDLSVSTLLVASQSTNKLVLSVTISCPKAKKYVWPLEYVFILWQKSLWLLCLQSVLYYDKNHFVFYFYSFEAINIISSTHNKRIDIWSQIFLMFMQGSTGDWTKFCVVKYVWNVLVKIWSLCFSSCKDF